MYLEAVWLITMKFEIHLFFDIKFVFKVDNLSSKHELLTGIVVMKTLRQKLSLTPWTRPLCPLSLIY